MSYSPPPPYGQRAAEPDWNALADRNAQEGRDRRLRRVTAAAVAGAFVVGGLAGWGLGRLGTTSEVAAPGPVAVRSSSAAAPTPASGPAVGPRQLADGAGAAPFDLGLAASVRSVGATPGALGHPGATAHVLWGVGDPDSYAATAGQVVDTGHSFTVSAWVLNKAAVDGRSAVSQGDGGYFGFDLGRDFWPHHNKWTFKVQTAEGNQDGTVKAVYSTADSTVGQWVHLTGSYDARAHTIALWVDGKLQGTTTVSGIVPEPGPLQLGRLTDQNRWADHWVGMIAGVQLWDAALTPAAAAATTPVHSWLEN
ncbi:hypothetical protein ABH931_000432 [Streptacidiphilus sp. MAP12-33]|uniref:LamG domain-containing protein n=1 Tax=Streptacidiphilus sp. MAP12-33 TaxID=3156266 RepID=UPI0035116855